MRWWRRRRLSRDAVIACHVFDAVIHEIAEMGWLYLPESIDPDAAGEWLGKVAARAVLDAQ